MPDQKTQPDRFWDWQSAALTVALVQVAASRLAITDWTQHLGVGQSLGFFGTLLGLALGYSILYPRTVRGFGLAYGLIFIPAHLLLMVERAGKLYYDLHWMLFRLFDAVALLFQNQPVYDPLFFNTLVAIGFWSIGIYVGYQLTRNRSLLGCILPAGIVMLVVQVYDPWATLRLWILAVYIFVALLLQGRLYFLQSKTGWEAKRIFLSSDVESDISRVTLTFAAIAIFLAWIFPSVLSSVGPAAQAWSEFTKPIRERFSDAVSALDSPYSTPISDDFYGAELPIGNSAPTSDSPVLYVKVERVQSKPARYYWRGRVYDKYVNGQWVNSIKPAGKSFNPETDRLPRETRATDVEAEFTVTMNFPRQELMYAPAEVAWTSRAGKLLTLPVDETNFEVSAWMAAPKLLAGDSYRVLSYITNPSVEELREAGGEYPQWVTERYLQLPPDLDPRFKEVAGRVTAEQTTPYDKAQAIANFLRSEIEYTPKIVASPPRGEDPIAWVAFEYKRGFCTYYASAEVLMLRSLGIPARMAVGFAQGEYDSIRRRYVSARADAHAWPEVYFPNIGWVEFEPTTNQDALNRPRRPANPLAGAEDERDFLPRDLPEMDQVDEQVPKPVVAESADPSITLGQLVQYTYPVFLIGLFALGIFLMRRYSIVDRLPVYLEGRYAKSGRQPPRWLTRWSRWARLLPMQRAFHAIDRSLRWLGQRLPAHATPQQRAERLAELLPAAREDIMALKEEHETALFTDRVGSLERARRAGVHVLLASARERINRLLDIQRYGEKI